VGKYVDTIIIDNDSINVYKSTGINIVAIESDILKLYGGWIGIKKYIVYEE